MPPSLVEALESFWRARRRRCERDRRRRARDICRGGRLAFERLARCAIEVTGVLIGCERERESAFYRRHLARRAPRCETRRSEAKWRVFARAQRGDERRQVIKNMPRARRRQAR